MHEQGRTLTLASPADALPLSVFVAAPQHPRAVVQLLHGMCEYKERYLPLIDALCNAGFACMIHDHRGHGKSVRTKSDLGYFYQGGAQALLQDVEFITDYARSLYPSLPLFMFAHSMGSLAARAYIRQDDSRIDGLILCGSPSKNPMAGAGNVLIRILIALRGEHAKSRLADTLFSDTFNRRFRTEGQNAWICSDHRVVQQYNDDPLCGYSFTLNGYRALLSLMRQAYNPRNWAMKNPSVPIRFLSGAEDPCRIDEAHFRKSVEFLQARGYQSVTSRVFPAMRHEIHNEAGRQQVYDDIIASFNGFLRLQKQ